MKYLVLCLLAHIFFLGCQSKNTEINNTAYSEIFDPVSYSKILMNEFSIEKQLRKVNDTLLISAKGEHRVQIAFLDSLSSRLLEIEKGLIAQSGGYVKNTGGLAYPLNKDAVVAYFYKSNQYNSYTHKEFDTIINLITTQYKKYLDCDKVDIFQFSQIPFYKNQEPGNNKPSDFLIKNMSTVEVMLILQNLRNQIEILKTKIILNHAC